MGIDYKKELETAAKNMILVHEPDVLIKMIARMLVQKVHITHAAILLHDPDRNTYVLTVSRGRSGIKIPAGYARVDDDNPLISFFKEQHAKRFFENGSVTLEAAQDALRRRLTDEERELLIKLLYQMEIFEAVAVIPSYFGQELMGVVLLGAKQKGSFSLQETDFFIALASDMAMAVRNARLFTQLQQELDRRYRLFLHTTIALAAAIDAKDHYTHGHTSRVTTITLEIAHKLAQRDGKHFDDKFVEYLHIASLLHDIGKIGIPESILNKNGPLNDEEREKMKLHPVVGAAILTPIKELEDAILGVKYHHERFDGSGYPEGLKGQEIPLIASIISVADTFDAMVTDRPYRKGLSKQEAINEIKRVSGAQFDSSVASAMIEVYEEGKI